MAITRTPMIDDDGTGTTGTVLNNAWKQEFYNQIDAANAAQDSQISNLGLWTPVPFSASDFTADTGLTWTVTAGNINTFRYVLLGKIMTVMVSMGSTTLSGSGGTFLGIKIPGGKLSASYGGTSGALGFTANLVDFGFILTQPSDGRLLLVRAQQAALPASSALMVSFSYTFEVL